MSLRDCLDAIRDATGGRLGDQEALEIIQRLADRAEARRRAGVDPAQVQLEVEDLARQMADAERLRAVKRRQHALLNAIKRDHLLTEIDRMTAAGLSPAAALKALMGGIQSPVPGTRASAWATQRAFLARYWGAIMGRIAAERPHIERLLTRGGDEFRAFDARVAREMEQLGVDGGQPGITGDEDARWLAQLFADVAEAARRDLNDRGASIGRLAGWLPHMHDPWRIVRTSEDEWLAFIRPRLDLERTFPELIGDDAAIDEALRQIYRTIASGRDLELGAVTEVRFRGPGSLARRFEHSRVLHFRPGQWSGYAERFGFGPVTASMFAHLRATARAAGLMEVFGPNPEHMIDTLVDALTLRLRRSRSVDVALQRQIEKIRNAAQWPTWKVLTGEVNHPANTVLARVGAGVRAWEILSKLMAAVLSALPTDPVTVAANLRFMGKPLLSAYRDAFLGYFRGRGKGEMRALAFHLGEGFSALIEHSITPYADFESPPGRLHKLVSWSFKISGLSGFTDIGRAVATRMMAAELGRHAGRSWDQLPADLRHVFGLHGLDARHWDVLRRMTMEVEGTTYVSPAAREIRREEVLPFVQERLDALDAGLTERLRRRQQEAAKLAAAMQRADEDFAAWAERLRASVEARRARLEARTAAKRDRQLERVADIARRLDELRADFAARHRDMSAAAGRRVGRRERSLEVQLRELDRRIRELETEAETRMSRADADIAARIRDRAQKLRAQLEQRAARIAELEQADAADRERFGAAIERILDGGRVELELALRRFFADEAATAILETDARTRAITTGGMRAGTVWGEAARAVMQFKSFPIAFSQRVLGRRLLAARGDTRGERLLRGSLHMGELLAAMTIGGLFAAWAKDLAKGRTPKALVHDDGELRWKTIAAAMAQGGGLGIYGDFLFAEYNRFGRGLAETLAGPPLGDLSELISLLEQVKNGEPRASRFLNFAVGMTPFVNLWYTRAAVDYLFLHSLRESVSPGWLARQRRRMREQYGQDLLVEPRA